MLTYTDTYIDIDTHAYLHTHTHTSMLTLTVCPAQHSLLCVIMRKRPHRLSLLRGLYSSLMASDWKHYPRSEPRILRRQEKAHRILFSLACSDWFNSWKQQSFISVLFLSSHKWFCFYFFSFGVFLSQTMACVLTTCHPTPPRTHTLYPRWYIPVHTHTLCIPDYLSPLVSNV